MDYVFVRNVIIFIYQLFNIKIMKYLFLWFPVLLIILCYLIFSALITLFHYLIFFDWERAFKFFDKMIHDGPFEFLLGVLEKIEKL